MSFYQTYQKYQNFDSEAFLSRLTNDDIKRALQARRLSSSQFLSLLSPKAEGFLENMAQRAHQTTLQHFGKTIQLYTPLYLSNYCENECVYCGFNCNNKIARKKLSLDELRKEAAFIASQGLRHILILTGGSRAHSPLSYIKDCLKVLREYFSSISIEIYALREEEYKELIDEGVDGLTLYQEVYDRAAYEQVHLKGPKTDYEFRLDAPERAARQKMRSVNIGVLLGLEPWRKEVFLLGLHARYLQDKFFDADIGISLPRLRPMGSDFQPACIVKDSHIVQIILALRIFLPRLGIALSTRESAQLRENLLGLGVTRMSAGSTTEVGGHTAQEKDSHLPQFEINDTRNVVEIKQWLLSKGYQPVLKDWMPV
ncbi:MAG: 2-iminoacetate synthase ThiH [Candidatus Aceula meridiana]|nr:2-iminoacetate synthase ThiH [Candidatus Aceula meridiana]